MCAVQITNVPKRFARIGNVAAKDSTRYAINGVHVVRQNGSARFEATDGRVMMEATLPQDDQGPAEAVGAVVPTKAVKSSLKQDGSRFELDNDMGSERFGIRRYGSAKLHCGPVSAELECMEGCFPNSQDAYPTDKPTLVIGFNAKLLGKLLTEIAAVAGKPSDGADPVVKLSFTEHGKAVLIECTNPEAGTVRGVIMPVMLPESKK